MKKIIRARVVIENGSISGKLLGEIIPTDEVKRQIVSIEIEDGKKQRNLSQNALYWLFVHFALDTYREFNPAMSPDDLHEYFKSTYKVKPIRMKDKIVLIPESTKEKGIAEFAEYFNYCLMRAEEDGAPSPVFIAKYEHQRDLMGQNWTPQDMTNNS